MPAADTCVCICILSRVSTVKQSASDTQRTTMRLANGHTWAGHGERNVVDCASKACVGVEEDLQPCVQPGQPKNRQAGKSDCCMLAI